MTLGVTYDPDPSQMRYMVRIRRAKSSRSRVVKVALRLPIRVIPKERLVHGVRAVVTF